MKNAGVLEPCVGGNVVIFVGSIFVGTVFCVCDLDHLYTGTSDGKIVDIYNGEIRTLATLGKPPCGIY